jgi:hypothetical protein
MNDHMINILVTRMIEFIFLVSLKMAHKNRESFIFKDGVFCDTSEIF